MTSITVAVTVNSSVEKVWEYWTGPQHITNWNYASDDWHCPKADNNLVIGGRFSYTMAAVDGSSQFDFSGHHTEVKPYEKIKTLLDDGRKMEVIFEKKDESSTSVVETFEAETENPIELQRSGWQAILNNFKKYSEGK